MKEYSVWTVSFTPVTMTAGPGAARSWCFILPLDALHEDAVEAARDYSRKLSDKGKGLPYVGAEVESVHRVCNAVMLG